MIAIISLVLSLLALMISIAALCGVIWLIAEQRQRGRSMEIAAPQVASSGAADRPTPITRVPDAPKQPLPDLLAAKLKTPVLPQGGFGSPVKKSGEANSPS